jgi:hypothetical protein
MKIIRKKFPKVGWSVSEYSGGVCNITTTLSYISLTRVIYFVGTLCFSRATT